MFLTTLTCIESLVDSLTLEADALFSPKSSAETTGLPLSVSAKEAVVSLVSSSSAAAGTEDVPVDLPFKGGTPPREKISSYIIINHSIQYVSYLLNYFHRR